MPAIYLTTSWFRLVMRGPMKLRIFAMVCTVARFVAVFVTLYSGAAPVPTEPGMMLYTPMRIEWLALELEASYRQDIGNDNDYSVHYIAKPPNTILILVHYRNKTSATTLDSGIDTAKQIVRQTASAHNWSSWVKVEVTRKLVKETIS